jgi:hypothetical protein
MSVLGGHGQELVHHCCLLANVSLEQWIIVI